MKTLKQTILILLCAAFIFCGTACTRSSNNGGGTADAENTPAPTPTPELKTVTGTMTIAKYGQVEFELYPQFAPQSALNFIYLAKNGCFNGIITDRIQKGFTIEMGKYLEDYAEVELPDGEYSIKGEFADNGVENQLGVGKGTLMWCRDYENPDSAQNEFMICLDTAACQDLQDKYAPFGKISSDGMDIIEKIAKRKVDKYYRPNNPVLILSVEIDGADDYPTPDFIKAD